MLAWWVDGGFLRQQKPSRMALAWWVDGVFLCQQKSSRMALAWLVDGGLAGLASRRGLLGRRAACCRFPAHLHNLERTARAERSDRTCTPSPRQEQGLPYQHSSKFTPHHKTPSQVRGSDYRTWRPS